MEWLEGRLPDIQRMGYLPRSLLEHSSAEQPHPNTLMWRALSSNLYIFVASCPILFFQSPCWSSQAVSLSLWLCVIAIALAWWGQGRWERLGEATDCQTVWETTASCHHDCEGSLWQAGHCSFCTTPKWWLVEKFRSHVWLPRPSGKKLLLFHRPFPLPVLFPISLTGKL